MKIVISSKGKVTKFIQIFRNLKDICNDVNINVSEYGMYAQGMDSSHISLFEFKMVPSWFDVYEVEGTDTLGVHCSLLFTVFDCIEEGQHIEILRKRGSDTFNVNLAGSGYQKEFQLGTIDIETEMMSIPEMEYDADIKMVSKDFSDLIGQVSKFGQDVNVKCNDKIELIGSSEELGKIKIIIEDDNIISYEVVEDCDLEMAYAIEFIKRFTQFSNINSEVYVHFSMNSPMKVCYNLDTWMENDGDDEDEKINNFIRFYLAPKMDED
tara:strand:- start:1675 stop:2475 length:801 start_codon:yes stop_codon:yes gene_type:complete